MNKATTCPYCGVGCGVCAEITNSTVAHINGDPEHPANLGSLCVKGSALADVLGAKGRLLEPAIKERKVSWESALEAVAKGFERTILEHGPDSVAFYLSGQLLTEDYYVANKLLKGFIGTANIDTNSRLCMASAVVGYKRAFGSDTVPCCYADLELTDLLVIIGSNAAWSHPILFQRMQKAKQANPALKVVVIDPRRTATCDISDLHLSIKPGTDSALFNGLLCYLAQEGVTNQDYIEAHTQGFAEALSLAYTQFSNVQSLAQTCDVDVADLKRFYDLFAKTEKVVSFYSQGVNQSSSGSDNANAIINCHLATGRIGYEGAGPFSITGQPNAMGGREVGGLANQLAAHMDFNDSDALERVARFWKAPHMAKQEGLKAIDMFEAIAAGTIKALWIMGTNPAVSMPNTEQVNRALETCPLVIISDCMAETDTLKYADICLPATGWSEKNGTVTNSERRISRQRSLLPATGGAKHDWWIISEVAKRMGFTEAFNFNHPYEIFAEHAALSGFENNGSRDFDISFFQNIDEKAYNNLVPVQWPVTQEAPNGSARMFSDGCFYTPSAKARFIPIQARAPVQQTTAALPFVLNTGRIRDQWHTMAVTGRASGLFLHRQEPFIELNHLDARQLHIKQGDLVRVSNEQGEFIGRARVLEAGQRQGEVFVPMHWNNVFSSKGSMGVLIKAVTDPLSGQPELKHGRVKLKPMAPKWQGWLMSRQALVTPLTFEYWSKVPKQNATLYYCADSRSLEDPLLWCKENLGPADIWLEDKACQNMRAAGLHGQQLQWIFFQMPYVQIPATGWLDALFGKDKISLDERRYLLSATGCEQEDPGELICSCFQVGSNAIADAIKRGYTSVEALGRELKCGTNCGSCIPEINRLIS